MAPITLFEAHDNLIRASRCSKIQSSVIQHVCTWLHEFLMDQDVMHDFWWQRPQDDTSMKLYEVNAARGACLRGDGVASRIRGVLILFLQFCSASWAVTGLVIKQYIITSLIFQRSFHFSYITVCSSFSFADSLPSALDFQKAEINCRSQCGCPGVACSDWSSLRPESM